MNPTDVNNPNYFHKVVDCQWACPAHTNVPEYIRLIAQGRYTDAYMLNRESNVFPAILGRTCDRPCEPACRRGRVDGKPVAICRLKRVAADLRDDITDRLPKIPSQKNGKRIACIGAGPASLTVANDLMPLGYEVVMFEKYDRPGGLMRTNIPAFRLPEAVLMDEINQILDMGVEIRYNSDITSMKALLAEGFDAIFVGTGAPRGKELDIPGRHDTDRIHIGIDWLESIAFGHTDSVGEKVLIIGVGNTAMDCCRSSLQAGWKRYQSDGPPPARLLQSFALGAGRRRGRRRRDPDQSRSRALRHRKRQAHRHGLRAPGMGRQGQKIEDARYCVPPRRRCHPRHRPGKLVPLDRARHRHRIRQMGHARGRRENHAVLTAMASFSGATRLGDPRTSSGLPSTATRPPSPSTITATA